MTWPGGANHECQPIRVPLFRVYFKKKADFVEDAIAIVFSRKRLKRPAFHIGPYATDAIIAGRLLRSSIGFSP